MSITVNLESEDNEIIESVEDNNLLKKYLPSVMDKSFYCIKYIDLYGDAIFNNLQMIDLIKEFKMIQNESNELNELINKIIGMAEKCKEGVHLYLKFYGD